MPFSILDYLENLQPDGGSHERYEGSYHCPICDAKNFKVDLKTGAYQGWSCSCMDTPAGRQAVRDAIAPRNWQKPARQQQKRTWTYTDFDGQPSIQVHRTDDGNGKRQIWQKSLVPGKQPKDLGRQTAPYRYLECLKALEEGAAYIFWVEGESCADALWKLGIPVTTTLRGSNGYHSSIHKGLFPQEKLVICPDQDAQGLKYAQAIAADYPEAQWLYVNPTSYLWERLPNSGGFDIADWITNGATVEAIMASIEPQRTAKLGGTSQLEKQPATALPRLAQQYQAIKATWGDCLRFNELTNQIELDGETVEDIADLRLTLALNHGLSVSVADCETIVKRIAKANSYHPVKAYLEACHQKLGDQVGILDTLATRYFGCTDSIHNIYLKKTLIAAVARIYNPGCKVDTALILNGPQGFGKSSFFRALAGSDWFDDSMGAATSERDERLKLHQFWFLEWAELEAVFKRKDVAAVKSFLTCEVDTVRPPYGRNAISLKRRSIIVGSTNQDEFLTDATGNRRFWVVPVRQRILLDQLRAERDQIWAAAVALYKSGCQWWLSAEEEAISAECNEAYRTEDPWLVRISSYLKDNGRDEVTTAELLTHALDIEPGRQTRGDQMRAGEVLKVLGWQATRRTVAGKRRRVWVEPEETIEPAEIPEILPTEGQPSASDQPQQLTVQPLSVPEVPTLNDLQAIDPTWTSLVPKKDKRSNKDHQLDVAVQPISDHELATLLAEEEGSDVRI
jgi:predicted P-loop ATPase